MKKKIIRNALTVAVSGLRKLIEDNSLNDADGSKIVCVDLEYQADCLCQIGLGEKISQYKYKFDFDKHNYYIADLLVQAEIK